MNNQIDIKDSYYHKNDSRTFIERHYQYILIAPTMFILVIVALIPFLYAVYLSFHEMNYAVIGEFSGLSNYEELFKDKRFWNSMYVSLMFVIIAVPLEFILGMIGALILNNRIYFRSVIIPILFIPTMLAPIVVAIIWKIMLAGSWGLLTTNILNPLGMLADSSIFSSQHTALPALMFIDVWMWTPFMTLVFFAGLQSLPEGPYKAADIDGANVIQKFFKLTLPMLTPLIAVIVLLRIIDSFRIFETIFVLTGGGPGISTENIGIYGHKLVFEFWQLGKASAMVVIVFILFFIFCNIFYQIAQKKLKAF